jgi:phage-related tail fiber protein
MAEQFYTILTQIGKAKIANAGALGNKVDFTHFALGDGNGSYYNPTESQTQLKNEVWRGTIGQVVVDEKNPNWITIETIIPSMVGGFMIREAGIFDNEGNLLAIGKYPETYKPAVETGSAKDLIIRMILEVSNTAVVNLKIDPTVILATKKDVDILSNRITKNEIDIAELKQGSTTIGDLQTENKTLSGAINELFQSGLDGKNLLETSIKSKGGTVSKIGEIATFNELDLGVKSIETDKTGDATATAADILVSKDAYVKGQKIKGTMPNRGAPAQTLTTQGGQYNIPAGYYSGGSVKAQFANLVAGNIKSGVNIGGVIGSLAPISSSYRREYVWVNGGGSSRTFTMSANRQIMIVLNSSYGEDSVAALTAVFIRGVTYDILYQGNTIEISNVSSTGLRIELGVGVQPVKYLIIEF